ncbi:DinB family protein [Microscilla marina]|uniref:Lipoprotein, putative n=1 Tax=Microscilla marina ATCC 23134 TaxID=313606 RepID=A1ZTJ6_MICM2|nr:DinB family protein [Microscilla marina]EAY26256.1 lipoprotein, putative [Microscilla marina ATCC 23134]
MNRTRFLKNFLGLSLLSLWGCQTESSKARLAVLKGTAEKQDDQAIKSLRQELKAAWLRSETMTLTNVGQMPAELFTFKYTDEAMTFTEQWRHCVIYTCGQLSGRAGLKNPYKDVKLPVQMSKENIIKELKKMYTFVRQSIDELSNEKLLSSCKFAGDTIPVWRLFYALENHIIHHRGQCVVYLRLKGVVPKGYYGW